MGNFALLDGKARHLEISFTPLLEGKEQYEQKLCESPKKSHGEVRVIGEGLGHSYTSIRKHHSYVLLLR